MSDIFSENGGCGLSGFHLLSRVGDGSETKVYKAIDLLRRVYVLKIPQKGQNPETWFSHQKTAIDNSKLYLSGYRGMISVPKCIFIEKYRVIENFVPGVHLTNDYYCSLAQSEKRHIASEFAAFLLNAHRNAKAACIVRANIENYCINVREGIEFLLKMNAISNSDAQSFLKIAKRYSDRDVCDEKGSLIHCDLSEKNLLYDKESNRLAVIDFANSCVGSIYEDFIAKYNALHCPYSFFHDVAEVYNSISHSGRVQQEKIGLLYYLSAINEVAAIGIRQNLSEKALKNLSHNFLLPRLMSIGQIFMGGNYHG